MRVILLDANAWIRERLLRSAVGAALLHNIGQLDVKIVLPEVTRAETIAGIVAAGKKAVAEIRNNLSTIQAIVGSKPDVVLPSAVDLAVACENRFAELADHIRRMSHQPEHLERALQRVLKKLPPASKKEQFRDSLIWELLLDLPEPKVFFVSADGDFTDQKADKKELMPALAHELLSKGKTVNFFSGVADLLSAIAATAPPLDQDTAASAIASALRPYLQDVEQRSEITAGDLTWKRLQVFITQQVDTLAINFRLNLAARFRSEFETDDPNATVLIVGECHYNLRTHAVSHIQLDRIQVLNLQGEPRGGTTYFAAASAVATPPPIPYKLRRPLEES